MGHTIQETTVTVFIGNYIRRVNVIKGSLYSRVYGTVIRQIVAIFGNFNMQSFIAVFSNFRQKWQYKFFYRVIYNQNAAS